jgi:predicted alpha/beta-hydrolase family hydrolase
MAGPRRLRAVRRPRAVHSLARYRPRMTVRVVLGHGASGTAASMAPFVEGLRARGIETLAVDLPKKKAEDVVPLWLELAPPGPDVVVGGQSFGGRVASLAAAAAASGPGGAAGYRGLVCFSYPLHRPGGPEIGPRVAHWPAIACPALLLSGESDPFARIDLLREAMSLLPHGELVTYPRLGHTVKPVLEDVLDRTAAFIRSLSSLAAPDHA